MGGIVLKNNECASTLRRYLLVRPLEIDGNRPLFYTDYAKRWTKRGLHPIFTAYKGKAGIEKHGSVMYSHDIPRRP